MMQKGENCRLDGNLTCSLEVKIAPRSHIVTVQITGFCPGFSECRVFSAGMKIFDKNPENTIWQ
jgi:hypothetical protein